MATVAHRVGEKQRTNDVLISENVSFDGLLLSDRVLNGLKNAGFIKPSPIQLKAIPLGRCGLDLIVQAKSGTGKTCVFSVIALESICTDSASTQVLVLAPTREIAVQIWEVIKSIGSAIKGLECHTFIGGLPLHEDRMKLKKCHIAVGSPGRIKQLIETGSLRTENIRMFILDEADKLLEEGFQEQINWIYSTLPENKQMLALSATYPEYLADHLTAYMRNPTFLRLNISDPALLGIRQYYQSVAYHPLSHVVFEEKCKVLIHILSSVSFQQCLVFSNVQTRASNLADTLTNKGWPTACIAGCLDQKDRNHAMAKLKTYKCRILISTDLTARGIDADKVNLVINMDMPKDHETYLHRIGRAGRFGSFGIAVSLISDGQEKMNMNSLEKRCNTKIHPLPDPLPTDLAKAASPMYLGDLVTTKVINTDNKDSSSVPMGKTIRDTVSKTETTESVNDDLLVGMENGDKIKFHDIKTVEAKVVPDLSNGLVKDESHTDNINGNHEMTLYDLADGPKNGLLHLTETSACDMRFDDMHQHLGNVNDMGMTTDPVRYTEENKYKDKIHEAKDVSSKNSQEKNAITCVKKEEDTLNAKLSTETKKVISEESSGVDKEDRSKDVSVTLLPETKSACPMFSPVSEVHKIPKFTGINLTQLFKQNIGYKKQTEVLTYSSAKQRLKEFRDRFTGYTEGPKVSFAQHSVNENDQEVLQKAVSQLQELFDRNVCVRVEPESSRNETENVSEISRPVDLSADSSLTTGNGEKDSEKLVPSKQLEEKRADQFKGTNGPCAELFESINGSGSSKTWDLQLETSCRSEDLEKHIQNGEETDLVQTKRDAITPASHKQTECKVISERKCKEDIKVKQAKPKKHYTNRFAIAHMLEPGSSVFGENSGGTTSEKKEMNGDSVQGLDLCKFTENQRPAVTLTQTNDWFEESTVVNKRDNTVTMRLNGSVKVPAMDSNENASVNTLTNSSITKDSVDHYRPHAAVKVPDSTTSNLGNSYSYKKSSRKVKENSVSNRIEECTSDSDSDSDSTESDSDTSDAADDDYITHQYPKQRPQHNPYTYNFDRDQNKGQYPYPNLGNENPPGHFANIQENQDRYFSNVHGNRAGYFPNIPGQPTGHFGGHYPQYQSYPHGFHPGYWDQYWAYRNNYGWHSQENRTLDMNAAMDRCYDEQREYIKAMSQVSQGDKTKDSKSKVKKKKKKGYK